MATLEIGNTYEIKTYDEAFPKIDSDGNYFGDEIVKGSSFIGKIKGFPEQPVGFVEIDNQTQNKTFLYFMESIELAIQFASVDQLRIEVLPLTLMGFTPAYYAVDDDGCAWVCEELPILKDGNWQTNGNWYELGIDDDLDLKYTPDICKTKKGRPYLFKIADAKNITSF